MSSCVTNRCFELFATTTHWTNMDNPTKSSPPKNIELNQCHQPSDFSIDHILNRAGTRSKIECFDILNSAMYHPYQLYHKNQQIEQRSNYAAASSESLSRIQCVSQTFLSESSKFPSYDWLQTSRFRPPRPQKNPNKSSPAKRTPGRLPRVPFTLYQLNMLEHAYRESSYLAAESAVQLAAKLSLTSLRVKIWFQNRRARERRERREAETSPPPMPEVCLRGSPPNQQPQLSPSDQYSNDLRRMGLFSLLERN